MKTSIRNLLALGLSLTLLLMFNSCTKESQEQVREGYAAVINVAADGTTMVADASLKYALTDNFSYSDSELETLLEVREEEKLARDVYTALYDKWGSKIFSNISSAEQTHMDAISLLLNAFSEEYASTGDPGEFTNPAVQELYTDLVEKGSGSIENAFNTCALIEEMDIFDIRRLSENVVNENIFLVFENLTKGSRNHLRAFTGQLDNLGLIYTPVYLTQDEFDLIVNSPMESGKQYWMRSMKTL